jgi:hypothetical protein
MRIHPESSSGCFADFGIFWQVCWNSAFAKNLKEDGNTTTTPENYLNIIQSALNRTSQEEMGFSVY